jgi:predicted metal-dependent phosphoesterase TrpH
LRLRIDLHVHSVYSQDSCVTFEDAIRRCHEEGLDGFAFTDHDAMAEFPVRKAEESGVIFIPGVEISANGAHILAFDIEEVIPPGLSIQETVERIHEQGGFAVIAHPYSIFRTWVSFMETKGAGFDAVEVANATQFPYGMMLEKNEDLAERLGLPKTGGSDAHIPRTVGRAYTILEAATRDVKGVISAIKGGQTSFGGKGISLLERLKLLRD